MISSRKEVKSILSNLETQKRLHSGLNKALIEIGESESYENVMAYYDRVIEKYEHKLQKLPIGHRYTGVFYLKKPYVVPDEFVRIDGSIFMREDLVSWEVEDGKGFEPQQYYRAIYKEPKLGTEIKREDGAPVYIKKSEASEIA